MQSSEEIRRVINRWLTAVTTGDVEPSLERLSEHPGALTIGTDPDEWWHGRETRAVWKQQLEELGAMPVTWSEIEAWEEGTIGWAATKMTIEGTDRSYTGRGTYVLRLERGEWKLVQVHWSIGLPNDEVLGMALTVSLEQLEQTIQRERPDLSGTLAADGTVTIVFTDIVDSTVLNHRLGDHAWLDILRRHNTVIEDATTNQGGSVVKTQGDGSMLAFSSARRAVACAQDIQHGIERVLADTSPPIHVRIGVHTGDAVREADDFFGNTVNYAARVASQALGGEVLVSSLVRELVAGAGPGIEFLESRDVELKGLDGSHRIYAIDLSL
jgi:class 3 adenylate cyclase/ketosteroid isomerase-like protein